jgi:hypothetical protein
LGAARAGNGWKNEYQGTASRCEDNSVHRSNLQFAADAREITKLPSLGSPSESLIVRRHRFSASKMEQQGLCQGSKRCLRNAVSNNLLIS